jgi:hypothetical protein
MNADLGSWLLGMSLGASAPVAIASPIFIVLAATTFGSALLYAISGFGFAVLAARLFLLFLDPPRPVQLVIIISTVLSIVVLRGCCRLSRRGCCFACHSEVLLGCHWASSPCVTPSDPGAGGRRSHDPWFHLTDDGLPAPIG